MIERSFEDIDKEVQKFEWCSNTAANVESDLEILNIMPQALGSQ